MQKIRIGIIGAGANTRKMHIPKLNEIEGVEIVGVVNRTHESSDKVAREFHIPRIYQHWREVVEDPDIDAIVIGTWPYLHAPITIAALEREKHVLTEARMAMNLAQAKAMYDASLAHPGCVTQVVPSPLTLHVDQTVKRLLNEGKIGKLMSVRIEDSSFFQQSGPVYGWRHDRELSGLNTMAVGIHYEIIARWVGHVFWVQAHTQVIFPFRKNSEGEFVPCSIPDYVAIQGELTNHIPFAMILNASSMFGPKRGFYLFGSEATLFFSLENNQLWFGKAEDEKMQLVPIPESENSGWRVEADFIDSIRNRTPARLTSFYEGLRYMAFTQAVAESASKGHRVSTLV